MRNSGLQTEVIFSVQESLEAGCEARARYAIFTPSDTLDELKTMLCEAVTCQLTSGDQPSVLRLPVVKDKVIPS